jgi:uncharacterized protein (TIGR00255 family)
MIRSMTGFGGASRELAGGTLSVELKSVNHRHLNISFRLPSGADVWEPQLRVRLARRVRRGHVTFLIAVDAAPGGEADWQLDHGRVRATLDAIRTLQKEYHIPGELDLGTFVTAARDMLREERSDELGWVDAVALGEVVDEALDELIRMRELEGGRLEGDLRESIGEVAAAVEAIQALAPRRLIRERDRLREAASELADGLRLDEGRLEQEIALLADKWDIGEEVVRARAHVAAFEELLDAAADEPVGKRLSFVLQELNREMNTVGSKANDTTISGHVVEAKNALERLREQVENIE